jgi:nitroreductase
MTLQEAILARHSVRQYLDKPIEKEKLDSLQAAIAEANADGRLHLQLVADEPEAFAHGLAKYGKFSGVRNYIALVCRRGEDELLGYRAERIVLLAQTLGLNSCWVGLTFRKQPGRYTVADGEAMLGVVALGYGANQGVQHPMRPMEKYYKASGELPDWFRRGMEAAMLAPTAVHQQKFEFELVDAHTVAARARFSLVGWAKIDLGIVKCNFELAAGKENFAWQ